MKRLLQNPYSLAWTFLGMVSFATAFYKFGHPGDVVLDESFGTFWASYYTGKFYIDIHPPHLRLLFGALAWLGGYDGPFPAFQEPYPGHYYLVQRAFTSLLAGIVPLLLVRLVQRMGGNNYWALIAGFACALENMRITESRLVLVDGPLLFFMLAAAVSFAEWRLSRRFSMLVAASFLFAVAFSIKWTSLALAVPVLLLLLHDAPGRIKATFGAVATILSITVVWYFAGFALHLWLLPQIGPDSIGMSEAFNARLLGSPPTQTQPLSLFAAIVELNRTMAAIASNVGPHPYSSKWYTWLLGLRGIYCWNDGQDSRIYLLPNLVVLWTTTLFMIKLLLDQLFIWARHPLRQWHAATENTAGWMALSFCAFILPYALIERPMFIYHYLPGFTFALSGTAVMATRLNLRPLTGVIWLVLAFGFFLFLAPLSYGTPLPQPKFDHRMLLASWP